MDVRIGQGYDIHQLVAGRRLILGGVEIPHDKGLLGHSDADVLLHAVIDALLGACALGDIGTHFPDTDPAYKDVSSLALLKEACRKAAGAGYRIGNIDASILCQAPRLAPYIAGIRDSMARALGLEVDRISVKAKSNEKLDAVGRGEAIVAQAVVLVEKI